ncbi:MAG: hypothetical protein LBF15_04470 [Candidatus Peribacteria bacterium]|jgi:hypothetical protein|nr:hypothetical protein [Candidatus Peribacteria bacterium]
MNLERSLPRLSSVVKDSQTFHVKSGIFEILGGTTGAGVTVKDQSALVLSCQVKPFLDL